MVFARHPTKTVLKIGFCHSERRLCEVKNPVFRCYIIQDASFLGKTIQLC